MRITYFLIFLISVLCKTLFAQNTTFKVREYSGKHGLAQNTVNCIMEDKQGFVWLGTQDGINKFDGYTFTHITNNPNDSSTLAEGKNIRALAQDNTGTIWIATTGNGINWYNPYNNGITRNEGIAGLQELQTANVHSFAYSSVTNTMWLSTEQYVYSYDINTHKLINYGIELKNLNSQNIALLNVSVTQYYVIVVDKEGVFFMRKKDNTWQYRKNKIKIKQKSASNYSSFSNDTLLLIGLTSEEVLQYTLLKDTILGLNPLKYKNDNNKLKLSTNSIQLLPNNTLVFTTISEGIYSCKLNESSYITKVNLVDDNGNSITANQMLSSMLSRAGTLWIGTLNNGVLKYQPENRVFNALPKLKGITVFGITQDAQHNLWLATESKGIYKYNLTTNTSNQYQYPLNKNIIPYNNQNSFYSLYCDAANVLHIGNAVFGLNKFDITNQVAQPVTPANKLLSTNSSGIPTSVLYTIKDSKQQTWVSTYDKGIFKINATQTAITQYHTMDNNSMADAVYQVLELQNGAILAATEKIGVMKYNASLNAFKEYRELNKYLNSKCVNNILQYDATTLVIATEGGIVLYDIATTLGRALTAKDGLPSQTVYGLLKDDNGYVWLSSLKGLAKFDPREKNIEFSTYTVEDGLQDSEFNLQSQFKCHDGRLVFGGINGVNAFYPNDIGRDKFAPEVYITSVKRNSQEAFETDTSFEYKRVMQFTHTQAAGVIRFEFVALSYKFPEKNKYQYMLVGFDKGWSEPSAERVKEYTNLEGGTYTFKVRACNSDGVWNNEGVSMQLNIDPIFYKTPWFIITTLLSIVLLVYGYIKWSTYQVQQKNKVLEIAVEDRTKELADKNRDVTASIEYAKRIQDAILPDKTALFKVLPNSFILYKPKDIVSGDFYWYAITPQCTIIAAVDCTGHGVPGAFMSMIGNNLLNQIINENHQYEPAAILDQLNEGLRYSLKNGRYDAETTDGMDVCICSIRGTKVAYAGAYRPLFYIQNQELKKIDGDKFPIGGSKYIEDKKYTQHELQLNAGDCIYLFSDGYGDQFGGDKGKKFSLKRMQDLFIEVATHPAKLQKMMVENAFIDWKLNNEQVDDVLVIGVKLT